MFCIVLGVCAALFAVLTLLVYALLFRPTIFRRKQKTSDFFEGEKKLVPYLSELRAAVDSFSLMEKETVYITSYDGIKLAALYVSAENAKGTVVCMHGYHGSPMSDFSLAVQFFHERGWNVLLPHERAHGESGGNYLTFGIKERFDCRDWAAAVDKKNGGALPIILYGVSMGASTVLMASSTGLSENVKCIIADCGYTSPRDEIAHVLKASYRLPLFPTLAISDMLARSIADFGLSEYSTLDALAENKIPVLFVHGDADTFVPLYMSEKNYEACKAPKELLIIKGSPHAVNYALGRKEYERKIIEFMDKYAVKKVQG
nr:alpha/beta hydrolase [Treponema socranskii]